jgi:hypothetical protein
MPANGGLDNGQLPVLGQKQCFLMGGAGFWLATISLDALSPARGMG